MWEFQWIELELKVHVRLLEDFFGCFDNLIGYFSYVRVTPIDWFSQLMAFPTFSVFCCRHDMVWCIMNNYDSMRSKSHFRRAVSLLWVNDSWHCIILSQNISISRVSRYLLDYLDRLHTVLSASLFWNKCTSNESNFLFPSSNWSLIEHSLSGSSQLLGYQWSRKLKEFSRKIQKIW